MNTWYRAGAGVLICLLLVMGVFAISDFQSRLHFVMATRGVHSQEYYEQQLRASLEKNPEYGYANLLLARLMMNYRKYGAALEFQRKGMTSFRPYRSYQQLASIYERQDDLKKAESEFEKSMRMNPSDLTALERLSWLAFQLHDDQALERHTDQLLRYDLSNLNAIYLRARRSEQKGNTQAAFRGYQTISTELTRLQGKAPRQLFFEPQEIASRLQILQPLLTNQ